MHAFYGVTAILSHYRWSCSMTHSFFRGRGSNGMELSGGQKIVVAAAAAAAMSLIWERD